MEDPPPVLTACPYTLSECVSKTRWLGFIAGWTWVQDTSCVVSALSLDFPVTICSHATEVIKNLKSCLESQVLTCRKGKLPLPSILVSHSFQQCSSPHGIPKLSAFLMFCSVGSYKVQWGLPLWIVLSLETFSHLGSPSCTHPKS